MDRTVEVRDPEDLIATTTLMEVQEFGEMMEHMDEVSFALDGLRPCQPVRVRRASLLSFLPACSTSQKRRLLRVRGITTRIIEAIVDVRLDDSPSTTTIVAFFFVLASDVLMNLTNDNPVGCQQIAVCGGLHSMVSIIVSHFPSFDCHFQMNGKLKQITPTDHSDDCHLNNRHLNHHELELLVAVLDLLVNLVEKNSQNSSRVRKAIADCFPNRNLNGLVPVLEKSVVSYYDAI